MASIAFAKDKGWAASIAGTPERATAALIVVFAVFRLILAMTLGLGVDESYGIGVSHDLDLSYFDYPPLTYWLIHFLIPVLGDGRALRLPFVALFAGTSWLLYLLTRQLFGRTAGVWAVLALNLSPFFMLAGSWVVTDGPLFFCLVAAAYTIACGMFPNGAAASPWRTWLAAGLWFGLAGLSKYHAALIAVGLLVYLASIPARWKIVLHPAAWVGALVALAVISPVIIWNAEHHWVSFAFQGGRALANGSFPKIGQFLANLGGQLLWMGPWVFVPMIAAAYYALRRGRADERTWYCLCLGLPTILLFTLVPLWGDRGLPHWQMPGWLMLFPALGDHLAREAELRPRPRRWAIGSAVTLVVVAFLIVGHAATGYGRLLFPAVFAKGDPTLEAVEWAPLREELQRRGLLDKPNVFVISDGPIDIAKIDQALHDAVPMQVFGASQQYAFRYDPKSLLGRDALILGQTNRTIGIRGALAPYFESIEELPAFAFGRSGMKEIEVRILYGHVLQKPLPSPYDKPAN
jgi:Dolichyl-phosphate-mannose-protein mannosyltransferase